MKSGARPGGTDYLLEYAREVDRPEAEALFICCGALRALDIGDRLEHEPVVVSNQAMMWDCLRLAGIEDEIAGYGRLALPAHAGRPVPGAPDSAAGAYCSSRR